MSSIGEESFEYLEKVTRIRAQLARNQEALCEALKHVVDRPYAVYLMYQHPNWAGQNYWSKHSKSSFKHEHEAIRRAAKLRLESLGPQYKIVIRKWDDNEKRWTMYHQ